MTDWLLLRKFKDDRSQSAFAEIVDRYVNLVYAACYAQLQDRQAAEDATQAVFLILARKSELRRGSTMAGWLFRTARYVSMHSRRDEIRRRKLHADLVVEHDRNCDQAWSRSDARLILCEALDRLGDIEREAVLLRYYQAMPLKDVGEALGITEEAARKRVDRGVNKLRQYLAGFDAVAGGLALTTLLDGHGANLMSDFQHQAIAHVVATNAALGQTASVTMAHQLTLEVLRRMFYTKLRIAASCAAIAIIGGSSAVYVHGQSPSTGHQQSVPAGSPPVSQPTNPIQPSESSVERQKVQATETLSVNRLKQIGLAIIQYVDDQRNYRKVHGRVVEERFPPLDSEDAVKTALTAYTPSKHVFVQPGVNKPYSFNRRLSRLYLPKLDKPNLEVLAYETVAQPDGTRAVLFADGHVKREPLAEWARIKKEAMIP